MFQVFFLEVPSYAIDIAYHCIIEKEHLSQDSGQSLHIITLGTFTPVPPPWPVTVKIFSSPLNGDMKRKKVTSGARIGPSKQKPLELIESTHKETKWSMNLCLFYWSFKDTHNLEPHHPIPCCHLWTLGQSAKHPRNIPGTGPTSCRNRGRCSTEIGGNHRSLQPSMGRLYILSDMNGWFLW